MSDKPGFTEGPWRWTTVDYDYKKIGSFSCYIETEDGPFDALWSDSENAPVFVAQDASSYQASCDFPKQESANLIAAAPDMYEAIEQFVEDFKQCSAAEGTALAKARAALAKARG